MLREAHIIRYVGEAFAHRCFCCGRVELSGLQVAHQIVDFYATLDRHRAFTYLFHLVC